MTELCTCGLLTALYTVIGFIVFWGIATFLSFMTFAVGYVLWLDRKYINWRFWK